MYGDVDLPGPERIFNLARKGSAARHLAQGNLRLAVTFNDQCLDFAGDLRLGLLEQAHHLVGLPASQLRPSGTDSKWKRIIHQDIPHINFGSEFL